MRRLFGLLSVFVVSFFLLPSSSFAHVKWFTDVEPERINIENVLSPLFIIMAFISAICLGFLLIIMRRIEYTDRVKRLQKYRFRTKFTYGFLQYGVALSILVQVINGTLFAPEFHLHGGFPTILIWFVILLFLIPYRIPVRIASIILLVLYIDYVVEYGLFHMLDYFFYIGVIGYFILIKTKWDRFKIPVLVTSLGFSLCWLAVEKWIYPGLTMSIIDVHGVPTMGFDPHMFTVLAAFVEFTIGVSWLMGILNRFFAIIFTLVMAVTTMFFGYLELVGHFLLFVLMIVFIAQNEPVKNIPKKFCRTLKGQMLFLSVSFMFILSTFVLVYYRFS